MLTNTILDMNSKRSIIELYIKTNRLFSGKIIIYIEEIGCVFEKDNIVNIIPKLGNKNIVSNNSYDVFLSSFIYGISKYYELDKTLKISILSKFLSDNNKQNLNIKEVVELYEKNN